MTKLYCTKCGNLLEHKRKRADRVHVVDDLWDTSRIVDSRFDIKTGEENIVDVFICKNWKQNIFCKFFGVFCESENHTKIAFYKGKEYNL